MVKKIIYANDLMITIRDDDRIDGRNFSIMRDHINELATDAVEVVHGRWDHNGNCSACNKNIYDDIDADMWACYEPPYCPNCGANMDLK